MAKKKKKKSLLTGLNSDKELASCGRGGCLGKGGGKGETGRRGRTERGEEQCEHVKLSELQIELGLSPQVAVDKQ